MNLLPHQKKLFREVRDCIQPACPTLISGVSGSGKTTILSQFREYFLNRGCQVLYMSGDKNLSQREYYPILDSLNEGKYGLTADRAAIEKNAIKATEYLPYPYGRPFGQLLEFAFTRLRFKKNIRDAVLTDIEKDIVCKLEALSKSKPIAFLCDNLQYWDDKSLRLLYILLRNTQNRYPFLQDSYFILSTTTDKDILCPLSFEALIQIDSVNKFLLMPLANPALMKQEFLDSMAILGCKKELSTEECVSLYALTQGHMHLLLELVRELNNDAISFKEISNESKNLLYTILEKRLLQNGLDGEKIKQVLDYAAALGVVFNLQEVKALTELDDNEFTRIIEKARHTYLIDDHTRLEMRFVHEIVHEVFQAGISTQKYEHYEKIELGLATVVPDQFLRRAKYALQANKQDLVIRLYILETLRQMRIYGEPGDSLWQHTLTLLQGKPENWIEYLNSMRISYRHYHNALYHEAYIELCHIDNIYPQYMQIEKELLRAYCMSKHLNEEMRKEGAEVLTKYNSLENCDGEKDIYERVLMRRMGLYAHLDNLPKARKAEEELMRSLSQRVQHDTLAQLRLNSVKKVASMLYDCEIACGKIQSAVKFFGPQPNGLWRDIIQYYISLVNFSGALCTKGDFEKAFHYAQTALELERNHENTPFPRPRVLANNYALAGYLSGNINIDACIQFFTILSDIPLCAERLFYKSNLSIFLALDNKLPEAQELLEAEALEQNSQQASEILYNYRVVLNGAVFQYLSGYQTKAICNLEKLQNIPYQCVDGILLKKRVDAVLNQMREDIVCDPISWENILVPTNASQQITPRRYYSKGFAFTSVFNWDLMA